MEIHFPSSEWHDDSCATIQMHIGNIFCLAFNPSFQSPVLKLLHMFLSPDSLHVLYYEDEDEEAVSSEVFMLMCF